MPLDLTFAQVSEFVRGEARREPKVIEALDGLLGLLIICSPLVAAPAVAAILPTLAVKNELIKQGKLVFERIGKKKDGDHAARLSRMQAAYGLICYTAFFEALEAALPESIRARAKLLPSEKAKLANDALFAEPAGEPVGRGIGDDVNPLTCFSVPFPHPAEQFADHVTRLTPLWKRMGDGFCSFIVKLAVWDELEEKERANLQVNLDKIAISSAQYYEAQYFDLCQKFPDFAVWGNLHEHASTRARISELSAYVQAYAKLAAEGATTIDVGLVRLQQAVAELPEVLKTARAEELATALRKHYAARIQDPIVDDREDRAEPGPKLSFPTVKEAFVPQSFCVLRAGPAVRQLEENSTWSASPRRNDLGAFLVSYLTSPYSADSPLLLLGHPGSGKSLLTTVLAAQLMSKQFTVIRVPLREVSAEAPIVSQIQEVIKRITNISVDSWSKLSATFRNNPPIVILDGYDELLQASGKVFAGYLSDVQAFQRSESEQGRPVRVIVTSRVTLIDKAAIPDGSTIARLLEFDDNQRARWVGTWNRANASYFQEAGIERFALPKEDKTGPNRVLALAEQPLLLLMLALYDSQDNQLRRSELLDRTRLYDSLLRRFVERELRKPGKAWLDLTGPERKKATDREMQRLAVAALGMYNRRQVHILAPELNDDLKFFKLERPVQVSAGRPMSQAELLLGSFFFVHKSAAHEGTVGQGGTETAAFEFLHNTFGEFLTADFIVRRTFSAVL